MTAGVPERAVAGCGAGLSRLRGSAAPSTELLPPVIGWTTELRLARSRLGWPRLLERLLRQHVGGV